jgi:hypothetical protein
MVANEGECVARRGAIFSGMKKRGWLVLAFLLAGAPVSAQTACPSPWRLQRTFQMGSVDGGDALASVSALETDAKGDIYLAQIWVPWIQVYDSRGRPVRKLGSAGQGPAEFVYAPTHLGWRGDTLWAAESSGGLHLFSPEGPQLGRVKFATPVHAEATMYTGGRPLQDGSVLGGGFRTMGWGAGTPKDFDYVYTADRLPILRFSRSGEILDTIALVGMMEGRAVRYNVDETRGVGAARSGGEHPFAWAGELTLPMAATPDGTGFVFIDYPTIPERRPFSPMRLLDRVAGRQATFDLLNIGIDGDTILRRTISYERKPVAPEDAARIREEWAWAYSRCPCTTSGESMLSRQEVARRMELAAEAVTLPEFYPPVRRIAAGHDGTIWLLREMRSDRADLWEIYDRTGRLEGSILFTDGLTNGGRQSWRPRRFVLKATRDEVWTTTENELEVPLVTRHRIDRTCRA